MAHVITNKYADHLPLYRQEGILLRYGVEISRSTLCDWMAIAAELLQPIVTLMLTKILESEVAQNDDSPLKVQDHASKGIKIGRLWVTIGDHYHNYVVYVYRPNRSGDGPAEIFEGFEGYLQADAYSGYDALFKSGKIIEVGCMMHGRDETLRSPDQRPATGDERWRGSNCSTTSNARRRRSTRPRVTRRSSPHGMGCGESDRGRLQAVS